MINLKLHTKPVMVDAAVHAGRRIGPMADWAVARNLNAIFLAGAEFADACREYPIVFVRAGQDEAGKLQVAPVAVFGVANDSNLYFEPGNWRAEYVPAVMRMYPFGISMLDAERYAVCIDENFPGFSPEGEAVFDAAGQPTEFMRGVQKQLENLEVEVQRTRLMCNLLLEKDLLRDMRFEAEMPGGGKLDVDGFLTVDAKRLGELADADVLALHRNGVLGLIHAHQLSLGLMRRLVGWHVARHGEPAPQAAAATPAPTA